MGLRQDKFTSIPGLTKLTSLYFGHGLLDWAIVALPHLRTLELGDSAKIELPADDSSAPNITSLTIENFGNLGPHKLSAIVDLLRRLPNLGSLELKSILEFPNIRHSRTYYGETGYYTWFHSPLGLFDATEIATMIETLSLTYASRAKFSHKVEASPRLSLTHFTSLRKVQLPETSFVGGVNVQQPVNATPREVLPTSMRTLVITHPSDLLHRHMPGYRPDTQVLGWLEGLQKTNFLDLERIEIVCSNGFGDKDIIAKAFEDAVHILQLKAVGVVVVVKNV
jgi:hypothetical protein